MRDRVTGPFFFAENTIAANIYLSMLQFGGTEGEEKCEVLFEEDGAPSDFSHDYEIFRMSDFSNRKTGRSGPTPWSQDVQVSRH
jgi:hypothetical protein